MDWAIVLSMPLMLLMGFIGDAISRDDDEDEGVSQADARDAEVDAAASRGAFDEDLAAFMAEEAVQEDAPEPEVPEEEVAEEEPAPETEQVVEPVQSSAAVAAPDIEPAEPEEEGDGEDGPEVVEDFDPEEDVLVFEGPGAAEAEPEMEQTEDGLLVRMGDQQALLPGVSELPPDAVVGVEPSPSA
ncbi:MAG: hypothetical protein JXQ91_19215 [Vannielia sp.]|uniref:hypothetical protein n=1 Tax=Vannielia sp. TaxID=2813045 RepID=UPI003B8E3AEC